MISLVLVIGLGGALLYRMTAQGGEDPSPTPAEQDAADRVTMLVASAVSQHVSTTAELYDAGTVGVRPEDMPGTLAGPAAASLSDLRARAAQLIGPEQVVEARVAPRTVESESKHGQIVVETTTAVTVTRERAAEAT